MRSAELLAPELLFSECANTLWKYVQRGLLPASIVLQKFDLLAILPVVLVPAKQHARRALEMAIELRHPANDPLYLAIAESQGVRVVTADTRLLQKTVNTRYAPLVISLADAAAN